MACRNCTSNVCQCAVVGNEEGTILVTGAGDTLNPYVVDLDLCAAIQDLGSTTFVSGSTPVVVKSGDGCAVATITIPAPVDVCEELNDFPLGTFVSEETLMVSINSEGECELVTVDTGGGGGGLVCIDGSATVCGGSPIIASGVFNSVTLGGGGVQILNGTANGILAGQSLIVSSNAAANALVGGASNEIRDSVAYSAIVGGTNNVLVGTAGQAFMAGGTGNTIYTSFAAANIGGSNNYLEASQFSNILGGSDNTVNNTMSSSILSGTGNTMVSSGGSMFNMIAASDSATMSEGVQYSAIIAANGDCSLEFSRGSLITASTNSHIDYDGVGGPPEYCVIIAGNDVSIGDNMGGSTQAVVLASSGPKLLACVRTTVLSHGGEQTFQSLTECVVAAGGSLPSFTTRGVSFGGSNEFETTSTLLGFRGVTPVQADYINPGTGTTTQIINALIALGLLARAQGS